MYQKVNHIEYMYILNTCILYILSIATVSTVAIVHTPWIQTLPVTFSKSRPHDTLYTQKIVEHNLYLKYSKMKNYISNLFFCVGKIQ